MRSRSDGGLRHNSLDEIAMRINEREATTGAEVLVGEDFKQGRFADPRLSDDVQMGEPVGLLDAEQDAGAMEVGGGEAGDIVWVGVHPRIFSRTSPVCTARPRKENAPTCGALAHFGALKFDR